MRRKTDKRHKFVRLLLYRILAVLIVVAIIAAIRALWLRHEAAVNPPVVSNDSSEPNGFIQTDPDKPLYVLLVGTDKGTPEQANFVGVAAVNQIKHHIDLVMLPDDTKIEGRKEKGIQALQDVYSEGGLTLTKAVVEDILHVPIPYYVAFTEDSFADMVKMSGGVPLYVEKDMVHEDAGTGATDINLFQGYQDLDGQEATGYMRYLDNDGYVARSQRQERLIKNFYEDRQQRFGIFNAIFMYRLWQHVDSNIPAKAMFDLAWNFRNVTVDNLDFYILPGEMAPSGKADDPKWYWTFDPVEVQKVIGRTSNAITSAPAPSDNGATN